MKTPWQNQQILPEPSLPADLSTDVVVVGGGITGTSLAYTLSSLGMRVIVLEKGEVVENATTAYTTGFLVSDIDTSLQDLVRIFGIKKAKKIWQSHAHAIASVEKIITSEKIECEFTRADEYWLATNDKSKIAMANEVMLAQSFGFTIESAGYKSFASVFGDVYVLRDQAKFHAIKYVAALREKAMRQGAVFFDQTSVKTMHGDALVTVTTDDGKKVTARHVVIATYAPFYNPWRLFAKKGMYVSYVYELAVPKGSLPHAMYQDDHKPYHYMRVDPLSDTEDRIIIGGEDRREELPAATEKNFDALLRYFETHFPGIQYRIITRWDGPILESIDGIPFIGSYCPRHPNRYVATAFSGNGMTYSYLAAEIISDAIVGKKNIYSDIYTPMRRHITFWGIVIKARDYVGAFFGAYMKNIFRKSSS